MKFTFMVFSARSGSTVIANLLSKGSEDVLVFPEIDFPLNLIHVSENSAHLFTEFELITALKNDSHFESLRFSKTDIDSFVSNSTGLDYRGVLINLSNLYKDKVGKVDIKLTIFQRPTFVGHLEKLHSLISGVSIIVVMRDPRASICSMMRSFEPYNENYTLGYTGAALLSIQIHRFYKKIKKFSDLGNSKIYLIRYEDFVSKNFIKELEIFYRDESLIFDSKFSSVGLVLGEREVHLHTKINMELDPERINGWQKEIEKDDRIIIERILTSIIDNDLYPPMTIDTKSYYSYRYFLDPVALNLAKGLVKYSIRRLRQYFD